MSAGAPGVQRGRSTDARRTNQTTILTALDCFCLPTTRQEPLKPTDHS